MGHVGSNARWQLDRHRSLYGGLVTFGGVDYFTITEPIGYQLVGLDLDGDMGAYEGILEPRTFRFATPDFAAVPIPGDTLIWHAKTFYVVKAFHSDLTDTETSGYNCHCYRTDGLSDPNSGFLIDTVSVSRATETNVAGSIQRSYALLGTYAGRLETMVSAVDVVLGEGQRVQSMWRLRLALGTPIRATDRVTINDQTFEVVDHDTGRSGAPVITARLIRVK